MEQQLTIRRQRLEAGEKAVGWKVGFGSTAAMARLGIDAPLVGFLNDKTQLASGGTAALTNWTNGLAEPEIALYLGRDLDAGADRETAKAAIAAVGPAIELADINFPPEDVEAILAGDVYHRHFILGRADSLRAGYVLDGLVGRVYHNENEIAAVTDSQSLTGDLIDIVRQVADLLAAFGETLRAGELIITGSIMPPFQITAHDKIRYALDPVDTISVEVI
jgi:2-keto-4-pentenoate hydratase